MAAGRRREISAFYIHDLTRELDLQTVTANCLYPATCMATTMVRQSGVTPISAVEEGAEAILNLAVEDGSADVPASFTTDCGRRRRTRRPMTTRRVSDCGCLTCN